MAPLAAATGSSPAGEDWDRPAHEKEAALLFKSAQREGQQQIGAEYGEVSCRRVWRFPTEHVVAVACLPVLSIAYLSLWSLKLSALASTRLCSTPLVTQLSVWLMRCSPAAQCAACALTRRCCVP